MKVVLQVSLYPLGKESYSEDIYKFVEILESKGLKCVTGNMSTLAYGEAEIVFDALKEAFSYISKNLSVVLVSTISNACAPLTSSEEKK